MKTKNRFRLFSGNITEIASDLNNKGFKELDACVSDFEENPKIFIDTENRTFYALDSECLKSSSEIVSNKFNVDIKHVELDEIKNWN